MRSDVAFVGRATAANDLDWQDLNLVLAEVPATFALSEAVSDTLLHDNHAPDLTKLDQAIAKLRIAIDKAADNPLASHNAIVLPFVVDTLRRDLGDLVDARASRQRPAHRLSEQPKV